MSKTLVIVESPSKAKTIGKYLGKNYSVKASVGHVKDLPVSKLGVDIKNDFEPTYEVIKGKKKVIDEIKSAAEKSDYVFLATDPDREGEAIAWHIAEEISSKSKAIKKTKKDSKIAKKLEAPVTAASDKIQRVLFHEITKKSILEAIAHPLALNQSLFDAQQARRVLDRLVGYQISPLLWEKVQRGLSAGRVQSVAVRIICEREAEIEKFVSTEYWSLEAQLEGSKAPSFVAKLMGKEGKKIELGNKEVTEQIKEEVSKTPFILKEVLKKERRRQPSPPFTTSTLQQEAARKLGYSAKKTMMLAQKLYEGVEVSEGETAGLITYMRTDSTRLSPDSLVEVREFILKNYSKDYLPEAAIVYKSKKAAQDAHEAIRPTSLQYDPALVAKSLSADEMKLYELIWKRFIACQMSPAVFDQTTFNISAGPYDFRATGSVMKFPGFIAVYLEGKDDTADEDEEKRLPNLAAPENLKLLDLLPEQHFTQPPPRFTDASLVKELEEKGIGRPSTYASILSTIVDKKYISKEQNKFRPTTLGNIVNNLLVNHFPDILNVQFTAKMEDELDDVEEGKLAWRDTIKKFYTTFDATLQKAKVQMKDIKRQEIKTDFVCEKCGRPMVVKFGRHGEFLACIGYPECKSTKEIAKAEDGAYAIQETPTTTEVCDKCASPMLVKRGRFGSFLACSKYPECKSTKAISIGVNCLQCSAPLAERKSKRGKSFYGCTAYPKCTFALWDKPVNEACPQCGSKYLLVKYSKKEGEKKVCPGKDCGYQLMAEGA
ncbi:MAG: type I DNA topoisomerase [Deltaproteobacteria bacterium]|nr:type I DNA topoisomerase [Deltaproteobacteria bacterium]